MTPYQYSQLEAVAILLLGVVLPLAVLVAVRRGTPAPVVTLSALVGVIGAIGFGLGALGSEGAQPRVIQVLINYFKDALAGWVVIYTCLMQVRRYRAARNGDRLRRWFERAPVVIGLAFIGGLVVDLVIQPPVLESSRSIPVSAFAAEAARYVAYAVYAALASFVFFWAAWSRRSGTELFGLGQWLQNLCGGIALFGLFALSLHTLAWRVVRALVPEERIVFLVEHLSAQEVVLLGIVVGSIALGLFCYSARSGRGEFGERFLNFVDLAGDLAEELANAPISEGKLNVPYACMHEAAGEEFLGLCASDKRKMDNAFCAKAIVEHRMGAGRVSQRRLLHLSKIYDDEARSSVLTEGISKEAFGRERQPLAGAFGEEEGLREALALVLRTKHTRGQKPDLAAAPAWEQLVWVALADAGLLADCRVTKGILDGHGVSGGVLDAYLLAKCKLRNFFKLSKEGGEEAK